MKRRRGWGWGAGLAVWVGASLATAAYGRMVTGVVNQATSGMNPLYTTGSWDIPHYNDEITSIGVVGADGIARITSDQIWTSDHTYVLGQPTFVCSNATLVIQPGTVIRGMPWRNSSTPPGALIVAPGSRLWARGTPEKPIIWTDMWDNNVPGMVPGNVTNVANYNSAGTRDLMQNYPTGGGYSRDYSRWEPTLGYWGGVILMGRCPIADYVTTNWCGANNSGGPSEIEGLNITPGLTEFGNGYVDDDDCSGCFVYNQIRYNGYPMQGASEINGLTLYGVGRGTEIHHYEVFNTLDDGTEYFGGSVNTKYVAEWNVGDDLFDSDDGYRGKNQFMFGVQGALNDNANKNSDGVSYINAVGSCWSDKAMEMDSSGNQGSDHYRCLPQARSAWWNITAIGKGPTAGLAVVDTWSATGTGGSSMTRKDDDQPHANTAILWRDGAAAQIYNSLFLDFHGGALVMTPDDAARARDGYGYAYDSLSMAKTSWTNYPVNNNASMPNWRLYQAQTAGYVGEVADCIFQCSETAFPQTWYDMHREAGHETSGAKNESHVKMWERTWLGTVYADGQAQVTNTSIDVDMGGAYYRNTVLAYNPASTAPQGEPIAGIWRDLDVSRAAAAKNVYNITNVDPRPTSVALGSTRYPPNDGFYTVVNYRGAFAPDVKPWVCGWTLMDKLGLINTNGFAASVPDATVSNAVTAVATRAPSFKYTTSSGGQYRIQSSTNSVSGPWVTVGYITGDGTEKWFVDPSGAPTSFFRVVRDL